MDYQILFPIISCLQIDVNKYSLDDGASYRSDIELQYLELSGEEQLSPDDRAEIISVLDGSYLSRILASIKWTDMHDSYSDGDSFSCIVDGITVTGTVGVHPKRLSVQFGSPFEAATFCELPDLSPSIYTVHPFTGSQTNEEGTRRIRSMVARKYYSNKK